MNKYLYDGPVMEFNTIIANNWKASTYAVSEYKARVNLSHRYKTNNNKLPSSKIILPGKIIVLQ